MKRAIALCMSVLLTAGTVLLVGCRRQEQAGPSSAPSLEQRISEIQNDPNMPPQAKGPAIAALRQQEAAAKARGQGSGAAQAQAAKTRGQATK